MDRTYELAGRGIKSFNQLTIICLLKIKEQRSNATLRYVRQICLEFRAVAEA
jgi:hypothetical protein